MNSISWQAPEHIHTEKTADWYWIVGIITVSVMIISIILNNVIFAILIGIGVFTLTMASSRRPEVIQIFIDQRGIQIGQVLYAYDNLDSFWVETGDRYPRILLKSKKSMSPYIKILIEKTNPEEIRNFLNQYLYEEKHTEPLPEKLLIYFGF